MAFVWIVISIAISFCFRPEQHGTDMLGPLSDILNTCTRDDQAPMAAMALEALYYLCEAEVC